MSNLHGPLTPNRRLRKGSNGFVNAYAQIELFPILMATRLSARFERLHVVTTVALLQVGLLDLHARNRRHGVRLVALDALRKDLGLVWLGGKLVDVNMRVHILVEFGLVILGFVGQGFKRAAMTGQAFFRRHFLGFGRKGRSQQACREKSPNGTTCRQAVPPTSGRQCAGR